MRLAKLFFLVGLLSAVALSQTQTAHAQKIPLWGVGNGTYRPNAEGTGGVYDGLGISTVLWVFDFDGSVQITGADDSGLNLTWQNQNNGTPDEQFHVCRTRFGQLKMRITGTTQLNPLDSLGNFTAVWNGRFEIVGGTGLFRRASGYADVVAENPPFFINDPEWPFTWHWNGRIRLW